MRRSPARQGSPPDMHERNAGGTHRQRPSHHSTSEVARPGCELRKSPGASRIESAGPGPRPEPQPPPSATFAGGGGTGSGGAGAVLGARGGARPARGPRPLPAPPVAAPPTPQRPRSPVPRSCRVRAPGAERGARPRANKAAAAREAGPGRAERQTHRAFVSGGAGAAAAAGRPERRMRRPVGRVAERCGGGLRGARPGTRGDLCV